MSGSVRTVSQNELNFLQVELNNCCNNWLACAIVSMIKTVSMSYCNISRRYVLCGNSLVFPPYESVSLLDLTVLIYIFYLGC